MTAAALLQIVYLLKAVLLGGMLAANSMMMGMMIKGMHQAGTTGHVTISSTVQTILTVSLKRVLKVSPGSR